MEIFNIFPLQNFFLLTKFGGCQDINTRSQNYDRTFYCICNSLVSFHSRLGKYYWPFLVYLTKSNSIKPLTCGSSIIVQWCLVSHPNFIFLCDDKKVKSNREIHYSSVIVQWRCRNQNYLMSHQSKVPIGSNICIFDCSEFSDTHILVCEWEVGLVFFHQEDMYK